MILHVLGEILIVEAILMLLPSLVALIYGEKVLDSYLITAGISAALGALFVLVPLRDRRIFYRDGFAIVSIGWILMSLAGALPFYLTGEIPSYLDAVFESVSGFTTTGASILSDVEALSHASLFWRSFTHWIGGMGVLAFLMVLIPVAAGGGNLNLLRAESPGIEVEKLVPKSNRTARILYGIYFVLTLTQLLILLVLKVPLFEALTITFGTAGTGGFAVLNSSVASYSAVIQITVTVFMILFGVNFNLYFLLICKRARDVLKSEELRGYALIMISAIVVVTLDVFFSGVYPTLSTSFQQSAFQVASAMTTTGFATADFNLWPEVSRIIMLVVMCIGSCAGSTAGGLKVGRVIVAAKSAVCEIRRVLSPRSVNVVTYEKKRVHEDTVKITNAYILIYVFVFALSLVVISFDRTDFTTNFSGVVATLNNIGPGLSKVGPLGNYGGFSPLSKLVFIFDMLIGRLEIFPIIILISSVFNLGRIKKRFN